MVKWWLGSMARQSTFSVAKAHEENQKVVLGVMAEKNS
jgi:hypothetical protein